MVAWSWVLALAGVARGDITGVGSGTEVMGVAALGVAARGCGSGVEVDPGFVGFHMMANASFLRGDWPKFITRIPVAKLSRPNE